MSITNIPISENTPLVILRELLIRTGFKSEQTNLLEHEVALELCRKSVYKIKPTFEENELRRLARWLNPYQIIQWKEMHLREAFDFYMLSLQRLVNRAYVYSIGFGSPTQDTNTLIPYHVLYIYLYSRFSLTREMENSDLLGLYLSTKMSVNSLKTKLIAHILAVSDRYQLSSIFGRLNINTDLPSKIPLFPRSKIPIEILANSTGATANSNAAAVRLAALVFKTDVSSAENPIREYQNLRDGTPSTEPAILRRLVVNRLALSLEHNFNGDLPESFYTREQLEFLAFREGYLEADIARKGEYELMLTSERQATFYAGLDLVPEGCSLLGEEFDEVKDELVAFGIKRNPDSFLIFTVSELVGAFKQYRDFLSPDKNISFSETSIRKLHNFGNKNLCDAINTVYALRASRSRVVEDFKLASETQKSESVKLLQMLLHLGMYMRGWDGESEYPVSKIPSTSDSAILRTSDSIIKLEKAISNAGELGNLFLRLPLFRYINMRVESSDEVNGITIGDKLQNIKIGDATNSMTTCIRSSSSWFCSTAHIYMTMVDLKEPYSLQCFVHIG